MKPEAATIPPEYLESALDNNPDGWGIMALVNGNVVVHKGGIPKEKNKKGKVTPEIVKEFMDVYKFYQNVNVALHFRYATHGEINIENTHPYKVAEDVYVMHNGVLSDFAKEEDQTKSDTWHFSNTIAEMVEQGWLRNPKFVKMMNLAAGSGNRLLFLDKEGFFIPKPTVWVKENGIWYSNDYGIDQLKPAHQYYSGWVGGGQNNNRPKYVDNTSVPDENGGALFLPDGTKLVKSYVIGPREGDTKNDTPKDTLVVVKDAKSSVKTTSKPSNGAPNVKNDVTKGTEAKGDVNTGVNDKGGTKSVDEILDETRFKLPKNLEEWKKLSMAEIENLLCYEPEMVAEEVYSLFQGV